MTSLRLTKQLSDLAEPLDEVADPLQDAVNALPKPVRDVVDGVWLGNPPHPALTDIPLGAWTAAFALDLVGSEAADDALAGHRGLGRVLSGVAYAGAAFSAHLGGHLSFGLGVRVNRTAFESPRDRYAPVCEESDLNGGKLVGVELEGESVVIARSEESGEVCAIAATCSHLGGPLDEGKRDGDTVICPWHGSRFDLCSGEVRGGPAVYPQPRYEARVRAGKAEIRIAK